MKFYSIALFLFLFNLTASVTTTMGMFGGTSFQPIEQGLQQKENVTAAYNEINTVNQQNGILGDLNFLVENIRLVVSAVGIFIKMFGNAVLVQPMLNNILCVGTQCGEAVTDFINIISAGVIMTYVIGVIQLISGRSLPSMQ